MFLAKMCLKGFNLNSQNIYKDTAIRYITHSFKQQLQDHRGTAIQECDSLDMNTARARRLQTRKPVT